MSSGNDKRKSWSFLHSHFPLEIETDDEAYVSSMRSVDTFTGYWSLYDQRILSAKRPLADCINDLRSCLSETPEKSEKKKKKKKKVKEESESD